MATRKQRKIVKFTKRTIDTLDSVGKEGKKIIRTVTPYIRKGIGSVYGTMATTTNLAIKRFTPPSHKNKTRKMKK